MALRSLPLGLLLALAACGVLPASEEAPPSEDALIDTSRFALATGSERLKQHRGPVDVVENQKASLHLSNAYWMARLSQLAYREEADLKTELGALGLATDSDHFRFFHNRCTDTEAFYVTSASLSKPPVQVDNPYNKASSDFAVLAFRGTERGNWNDIATDLYAWNRPNVSIGSAHAGFGDALASIWEKTDRPECIEGSTEADMADGLGAFLRAHHSYDFRGSAPKRLGAELYLTGHSLGGALATLALVRTAIDQCDAEGKSQLDPCAQIYTPVSALLTFGSPRVGDLALADSLARRMQDRTPIFRVVHRHDGVASVPSTLRFRHPGFDGEESTFKVHIADEPLRMKVGGEASNGEGSLAGDHVLGGYVSVLEKLAAREK